MTEIKIGGRLHSTATGNVVAGTNEILDDNKNKKQSIINQEVDETLDNHNSRINALTEQNYITVEAVAETTDVATLINNSGHGQELDTIYRVSNWDGSQYATDAYCEYSYDKVTSSYKLLHKINYGIDNKPTADSNNLVKSGGVKEYIDELITALELLSKRKVTLTSKNLFIKDSVLSGYILGSDGNLISNSGRYLSDYVPVSPSTQYIFSGYPSGYCCFYDQYLKFISSINANTSAFTTPSNAAYLRVATIAVSSFQIEQGSSATSLDVYSPYIEQNYLRNIRINTENILDGKVTFTKLASDVKNIFVEIDDKQKELLSRQLILSGFKPILLNGYWDIDDNVLKFTENNTIKSFKIPVKQGDVFNVYCAGAGGNTLYVIDEDYEVIYTNGNTSTVMDDVTISDANSAYLICNINSSFLSKFYCKLYGNLLKKTESNKARFEGFDRLINYTGIDAYVDLDLQDGYVDYETGIISNYSGSGVYKVSRYISINHGCTYYYEGRLFGNGGVAFYDYDYKFISGYTGAENANLIIPANAYFMVLSDVRANADHSSTSLKQTKNGKLSDIATPYINCFGDSVTFGLSMDGAGTAAYGKEPYPAQLYTMLKDAGYDINVNNFGHSGERSTEIGARMGAYAMYNNVELTIPADNTPISLGDVSYDSSLGTQGTKLSLFGCKDKNNNDCKLFFESGDGGTNPVLINGKEYNLQRTYHIVEGQAVYYNTLARNNWGDSDTVIPANSIITTSNSRDAKVNIFYMGANDNAYITFDMFKERVRRCAAANNGRYIVIGSTMNYYQNWVEGTESGEEKWTACWKSMNDEFGLHYIDLRREFKYRAVDICMAAGLMDNLTSEEIEDIQSKLDRYIMPGFFTYDNSVQNVHLSAAGYYVFATLVFERIKQLNYI